VIVGTPALSRFAPREKSLPAVFAMVGNPYFSGAAYDPQHPEWHQFNITGLASPAPVRAALEQGARLLGPRPWGMLFDPLDGQAVELAGKFEAQAREFGLTPLLEAGSDAAADCRGLERLLARGAKVIYLPPTATAGRYAPLLLFWGQSGKVLVVSSHPEAPPQGAILSVILDYFRLGEEAAQLAKRVLQGEPPSQIPIAEKVPVTIRVDEALLRRWSTYPLP
jgi:putative ABC transport system substrate-binding protein